MRKVFRKTLKALAALLLVACIAAIVLKLWLAPAIVRWQISRYLPDYWTGQLQVDTVELNLFAPSRVSGVTLTDLEGRPWASVGSIQFRLRDWPGLHPALSEIVVDDLDINLFFAGRQCQPPLVSAPPSEPQPAAAASPYLDLRRVQVRNAAVTVRAESGLSRRWNNILLDVEWKSGRPEFWLNRYSDDGSDWLSVMGSIDPATTQCDLVTVLTETADLQETATLLSALGSESVTALVGTFAANFSVSGRLNDPSTLQWNGQAGASGVKLFHRQDEINDDLDLALAMRGRDVQITSLNLATRGFWLLSGKIPLTYDKQYRRVIANIQQVGLRIDNRQGGGAFWDDLLAGVKAHGGLTVSGSVAVPLSDPANVLCNLRGSAELASLTVPAPTPLELNSVRIDNLKYSGNYLVAQGISCNAWTGRASGAGALTFDPFTYELRLDVENLAVGPLVRTFKPDSTMQKGLASGWVVLGGMGATKSGLTLDAGIFVDNADLEVTPLFNAIMQGMSLTPQAIQGIQGNNDLAASLSMEWPVMRVRRARVANNLAAFDVEPGGTINLDSGQLNFYVVTGALNDIRLLPVVPLTNFSKRLSRLHIEGNAAEPPAKLIHKDAVRDLAGGTVDFFRDSIRTGGQIGRDILSATGFEEAPPRNRPASAATSSSAP